MNSRQQDYQQRLFYQQEHAHQQGQVQQGQPSQPAQENGKFVILFVLLKNFKMLLWRLGAWIRDPFPDDSFPYNVCQLEEDEIDSWFEFYEIPTTLDLDPEEKLNQLAHYLGINLL
ncbi:hypothetical protein RCL_jg24964.t1 [Rhizophagus clarus]|uniref:Uncharacterized protein n=1 Tax=Rhizophagus clarus TaxID=94130 RepID=A0A8H3LSA7_9GLOM|nr:hypothetical protein RCL_jg24964.t1 [Rhizophagus clarus]